MKKIILISQIFLLMFVSISAQEDTTSVQDAAYNRPFISSDILSTVAVGGYLEGNTNYFSEDGVSEGFSMEFRRFNIFLYSTIIPRIKFLAELEFEHGAEEIALETAQVDFVLDQAFVLRGGIIIVPIGAFNQNHDSPKWEFVERPLVSTQIIPSTLSEVGFGVYGKFFLGDLLFTYDAYLVNGLSDGIILNSEGRTFLQSGKTPARLEEDNNASPTLSGRASVKSRKYGELGLSYYGGAYNTYELEGMEVDEKRNLGIVAADFNTKIEEASIRGEFAVTSIDVPKDITEIYGTKQWGGYVEIIYPIMRREILGFEKAVVNVGLRLERIDYNVGVFSTTGKNIFDEVNALAFALSFRPSATIVLRANYRHHWTRDALGNQVIKSAGFQFGLAAYF
ncbi:MAG: hypothetical protein K9G63_03150 [Melioribacteraceae bacterium]|nr:hypothetical protein [Melioribacteraceae bacterium]